MTDLKTEARSAAPPVADGRTNLSARELSERVWLIARGLATSAFLPWAIVALGIVLRVVRYAADRSLWLDEAYLALNLTNRSFDRLFGTLDFNQAAPPLFLAIEKAAITLFGDSEYALRLFPLLAGVAAMVLAYPVARRWLSPPAVPIALFLFAVLEPFTFFAAEVKQYSSDILVTLVLLYLCARALDSDTRSFTRWTGALAIAGVIGVALSYPSVFVLAGVACAVALNAVQRRDRRAIVWVFASFGAIFAAFLVIFAISIRSGRAVQASASAISPDAHSVLKNTYLVFTDPAGLPKTVVGVAALIAALGFVSILGRSAERALGLAVCVAAFVLVGAAGEYPVGQRFLAFALPLAVLGLAQGTAAFAALNRPLAIAALATIAVLVFASPTKNAIARAANPPRVEDIKPLLHYIGEHWRNGDTLYVSPYAQYAFRYYVQCRDCDRSVRARGRDRWPFIEMSGHAQTAPALRSQTRALIIGRVSDPASPAYAAEVQRLRRGGRTWVLVTHYYPFPLDMLTAPLDRFATPKQVSRTETTALFLYHF